jgi:cyanate permease
VIGFVSTLTGSLGPVAAGRLFDASGSYTAPFTLFLVSLTAAALLPIGCMPLASAPFPAPELAAV